MIKKKYENYAIFGVKRKRRYAVEAQGALMQFAAEAIDLFCEWKNYTPMKIEDNLLFWEKIKKDYPKVYEVFYDKSESADDQPIRRNKFRRHVDLGAFYSVNIRKKSGDLSKYRYFVVLEVYSAEMECLHETMRRLGDSLQGAHFLALLNRCSTDFVDLFMKIDFHGEDDF